MVRRWIITGLVFLVGGVVINTVVALALATIEWRHWTITSYGITAARGAGWYLYRFEGPGFSWEVGWPVRDVDVFFTDRLRQVFGEYPEYGFAPDIIDPSGWGGAFATPPSERAASLLRVRIRAVGRFGRSVGPSRRI